MSHSNLLLKVADFSLNPGPRYKTEGAFSAEEFREDFVLPKVREAIRTGAVLTIVIDGVHGYGTSFFEESFAGLIRVNGFSPADLKSTLKFISDEVPRYLEEIERYMAHAASETGS